MALSNAEQVAWLEVDVLAAIDAIREAFPTGRLTVVAKSLTTLGLAAVDWNTAMSDDTTLRLVWLTPLLREPMVVNRLLTENVSSLAIIGTADHHFDVTVADRIGTKSDLTTLLLIEGADHSFDQRGSITQSLENVGSVVEAIRAFAFSAA